MTQDSPEVKVDEFDPTTLPWEFEGFGVKAHLSLEQARNLFAHLVTTGNIKVVMDDNGFVSFTGTFPFTPSLVNKIRMGLKEQQTSESLDLLTLLRLNESVLGLVRRDLVDNRSFDDLKRNDLNKLVGLMRERELIQLKSNDLNKIREQENYPIPKRIVFPEPKFKEENLRRPGGDPVVQEILDEEAAQEKG